MLLVKQECIACAHGRCSRPIVEVPRGSPSVTFVVMTELYASLLPGGSRDRPIKVTSASVVEVRTAALTCPHCGVGTYRIEEHVAPAAGVRRVDVTCRNCGEPRSLWFRLVAAELN